MEWGKRNYQEEKVVEKEKRQLQEQEEILLKEEKVLNEEMRKLKKREFDDIAKKHKINETKKELLDRLKTEETTLSKECLEIEQEMRIMEVLIRNHIDMEENLELKMMGLELSEDVWKKKWGDQHQMMEFEKQRLQSWENELNLRQEKVDKTDKNQKSIDQTRTSISKKPIANSSSKVTDNKAVSNAKKAKNRSRTSGTGLSLVHNKSSSKNGQNKDDINKSTNISNIGGGGCGGNILTTTDMNIDEGGFWMQE